MIALRIVKQFTVQVSTVASSSPALRPHLVVGVGAVLPATGVTAEDAGSRLVKPSDRVYSSDSWSGLEAEPIEDPFLAMPASTYVEELQLAIYRAKLRAVNLDLVQGSPASELPLELPRNLSQVIKLNADAYDRQALIQQALAVQRLIDVTIKQPTRIARVS